MPGKYDSVIDKLPAWIDPDANYQQKINETKKKILESDPLPMVESDQIIYEEIQQKSQAIKEQVEHIRQLMIAVNGGRRHGSVFAKGYRELRRFNDIIQEAESTVNLLLRAYEALIVDQYENEGVTSIKLEDASSVSVQFEPYAQVTNRDEFWQWCKNEGLERSMSLAWMTTNSLTKERLLKGQTPPDGITAHAKPKLVLRNAKE